MEPTGSESPADLRLRELTDLLGDAKRGSPFPVSDGGMSQGGDPTSDDGDGGGSSTSSVYGLQRVHMLASVDPPDRRRWGCWSSERARSLSLEMSLEDRLKASPMLKAHSAGAATRDSDCEPFFELDLDPSGGDDEEEGSLCLDQEEEEEEGGVEEILSAHQIMLEGEQDSALMDEELERRESLHKGGGLTSKIKRTVGVRKKGSPSPRLHHRSSSNTSTGSEEASRRKKAAPKRKIQPRVVVTSRTVHRVGAAANHDTVAGGPQRVRHHVRQHSDLGGRLAMARDFFFPQAPPSSPPPHDSVDGVPLSREPSSSGTSSSQQSPSPLPVPVRPPLLKMKSEEFARGRRSRKLLGSRVVTLPRRKKGRVSDLVSSLSSSSDSARSRCCSDLEALERSVSSAEDNGNSSPADRAWKLDMIAGLTRRYGEDEVVDHLEAEGKLQVGSLTGDGEGVFSMFRKPGDPNSVS